MLSAAALAAVLLAGLSLSHSRIDRSVENGGDWYSRSPGWFVTRGVYPTEHTPDGAAFAWAGGRVRLQIPRLDRRIEYELGFRARSGRAAADPPATVRLVVDGADTPPVRVGSAWETFYVTLPRARRTGAVILADAQHTFTPGPQDARQLAFMFDRVTLRPIGASHVPVPRMVLVHVAVLAGAMAGAALLSGFAPWLAFAAGLAGGAAGVWLSLFDDAGLGEYSDVFVPLAAVALLVSGTGWVAAHLARAPAPAWRKVVFIAAWATILKLAVFLHPSAPVSDGMFHVHRAQAVRAGEYLFTSVTPRPFYEFPYPVGLYVMAQPFWTAFGDRVFLLRAVTLVFDALVAVGLFAAVSARWKSRRAGLLAAVFALAVPVVLQSVSTANLTNVFAQSCFSLALVWIGWHLDTTRVLPVAIGGVVFLSAAFLSHFSTAVVGAPAAIALACAVAFSRDRDQARAWRWILAAVAVSLLLSYITYYSQFNEVYARTLSRVGAEGADNSFVATLEQHSESKLVTMLRFVLINYGWGALTLGLLGAIAAVRRDWREGWTLMLAALCLVVLIFLLLGAFTPVEMRASLAAHPAVAAFAALGFAWLWNSGRTAARAAALVCLASTVWLGIMTLRGVLGG